ncbi:MFS transporter [Alicyclobacillus sp. SO9]|uniref:MFS transporter n=1 Tax=Alicyclobacillus sp. SO9 TaxID=2665646 RepID=UPI0018E8B8C8|nr:MFS transporter [Alicyclobacillus sp. SO9]QQE77635.1 MFS transporter [Alicyclobacillus sp. SO9]
MDDETSVSFVPLIKNRPYLVLISAQSVSNLGDWLYILALIVLVGVHWHASPGMIAVMMLCLSTPMILLGPFVGVLADRFNRTVIMMLSNLVMAALVMAIPSTHKLWVLFLVLIAIGSFESLFAPAEQGKLKEIVPDHQIHQATATKTAVNQITKVIGPGLSGLLVASFGAMSAFYLDGASFIISTVLLLFTMRVHQGHETSPNLSTGQYHAHRQTADSESEDSQDEGIRGSEQQQNESFLARFRVGWNHILKRRFLLVGLFLLSIILLIIQLTDSQFITLLRLLPNFTPNLFGYLMAAAGGGTLITALISNQFKKVSSVYMMGIGSVGLAVGYGGIACLVEFHWAWWLIPMLAFIAGIGAGFVFIPFQAAVQRDTPVELTGRVFGVIGSFTTGAALLGPVVGGAIITLFGPVDGFLITGTALAIIAVGVLILKNWMKPGDNVGTKSDGRAQETTTG